VRIDLAYDGTDFAGWAMQPGLRTVEGDLMAALDQVLRLPESPRLVVAGRTDAGVHARGQVAHVDLPEEALAGAVGRSGRAPVDALQDRLSGVLGPDIVVRRVALAPPGFDARFAALRRRYAYRIADVAAAADPLRRREVLSVRGRLDVDAMNTASSQLLGLNDFAAFCKRRQGATTIRTLLAYSWGREGDLLVGGVVADAFCHSMVRALVGAVLEVGRGRRPVEWPLAVLTSRVREPSAPVVPPHGLCLEEVVYPSDELLAHRVSESRTRRRMRAAETGG
jgi:tRNA pseudouridine38-40 synthase